MSSFTEIVHIPVNVQVFVSGDTALVHWAVVSGVEDILRFELTYELVGSSCGLLKVTHGISRLYRTYRIVGLVPNTQ